MPDYFYDKVFKPLYQGKMDEAYQGYQDLMRVNRTPSWDATRPEPLQRHALRFLEAFRDLVADEVKDDDTLLENRAAALDKIQKFVNNQTGPSCAAFPHINPYRYAIDLALRVRRPRIIDQSETTFCGPVCIMCAYFKTDPKAATKFALNLVENGWGMLKQYRIDPEEHIKNKAPPDRFDMTPVDWLLLTSLRYHFEPLAALLGLFSKDAADPLRQLTKPGLLTAMLTKMGYKAVSDRTFGFETLPTVAKVADAVTRYSMRSGSHSGLGGFSERAHLESAARNLARGRLIFLLAYIRMSEMAPVEDKSNRFPKGGGNSLVPTFGDIGLPELHWTLVRKLTVVGDRVLIRFYTWGKVREANFAMDPFLRVYRGYVWADPS
jgi:hypothetical protein